VGKNIATSKKEEVLVQFHDQWADEGVIVIEKEES